MRTADGDEARAFRDKNLAEYPQASITSEVVAGKWEYRVWSGPSVGPNDVGEPRILRSQEELVAAAWKAARNA